MPEAAKFIRAGDVSWNSFEDGFPNIMIEKVDKLRNRHCLFLADFLNPADMFHQLSLIYSLPAYWAKSLTVILPYFPTGTMERVDYEGQIATAKTLARMLSAIPLCASGPTRLMIFDIHALQERFYFGENIIPILESATHLIVNRIHEAHLNDKITIAFPDEGAQKRFGNRFPHFEQVICTKVRTSAEGRKITIKEGDVTGRHCFIIDDLVKTGGTLIQCKNALMEAGATAVSAFVTHAVFPQESWKKFLAEPEEKRFKNFYVTDSCPTVSKIIDGKGPFKVLSIADSILSAITKYQH
jgi:ribose-phosphate pyrophosphokinase